MLPSADERSKRCWPRGIQGIHHQAESWYQVVGIMRDRQARLEFRRADLRGHAGFKTCDQAFVQVADFTGLFIRGQNNLFALVVERVEHIEKLFLHLSFLGQTVHVVDQQDVNIANRGAKLTQALFLLQQVIEVIEQLIAGGVADAERDRSCGLPPPPPEAGGSCDPPAP